jgi:hypothetical protein
MSLQYGCTVCAKHTIGSENHFGHTRLSIRDPRGSSSEQLLADEDINTDHTSTPSTPTTAGPITRARAPKVNHQVSSFLSSCPSCLDLGDKCTLVLIRNQGEDRKGKGLA